jgi:hypothetical protein
MKKNKVCSPLNGIFIILLSLFLLPSCNKDKEENLPLLPPESCMLMDFSDFYQTTKSDFIPSPLMQSEATAWYWLNAATHVKVWKIIITVGLAVPVAAFVESFNHQGVYQGDREWAWTYDVTTLDAVYTADLNGTIQDTTVLWQMYVSKSGGFEDFLWYYGEVNLARTCGYWIMNDNPTSQSELLRIDWTREPDSEVAEIKYTNIQPGGAENGGYIQYGILTDENYNRFYDIYVASTQRLVNIKWNSETKEGRIKDPYAYQDENWHCWDSNLQDIVCDQN